MKLVISLNKMSDIQKFVNVVNTYASSIDASSVDQHYTVDAKSLLGVIALDPSKPVVVSINATDKDEEDKFIDDMRQFMIPYENEVTD